MAKKVDRRVKYTMSLLKSTLIEMMEDTHISQISVKKLCEKADVNRSTFYAHYTDVYDLLRQIEDELFEYLTAFLSEQDIDERLPVSEAKLTQILSYVSEDDKTLFVLLGGNSDIAIQRDIIQFLGVTSLQANIDVSEPYLKYINLFCIHGCISVIQKWLQEGMKEPVEDIAKLLYKMLTEGVNGF